jgi:hypothetical protein
MTLMNDLLKQMPGLGQPQRKFLATLFVTILVLRGRVNFRNLSRYCDYSERTIARQFREPFDGPDFHQRVLMTTLDPNSELISAHDAAFIPRSGKQTFGLGHFFNHKAWCRMRMFRPVPSVLGTPQVWPTSRSRSIIASMSRNRWAQQSCHRQEECQL